MDESGQSLMNELRFFLQHTPLPVATSVEDLADSLTQQTFRYEGNEAVKNINVENQQGDRFKSLKNTA